MVGHQNYIDGYFYLHVKAIFSETHFYQGVLLTDFILSIEFVKK